MIKEKVDLAIIGAGPAGLAAALEAKRIGIEKVVILERDNELGGILKQCIHDGFGLHRFKEQLSGPTYAQKFIDELLKTDVEIKLNTMVIDVNAKKEITAINAKDGILEITAKSIIFAMGCRERTRNQVYIFGTRPQGIMTAGAVQRYINIEGYLPGKKAVILGSGDIGLIMARRMTLEGVEVEGVYEVMERPGGLQRNIHQCLNDYQIPLYLSTTVVKIHGNSKIEGVTIQQLDQKRNLIPNTERYIPCDLLVLSVGLIPENELSKKADVPLCKETKGPELNNLMMTDIDGIFAAGNVTSVFDLVDYVSLTGEIAARGVKLYLENKLDNLTSYKITQGENVRFLLPQKLVKIENGILEIYFRPSKEMKNATVTLVSGNKEVLTKKINVVRPQEMVRIIVPNKTIMDINSDIQVNLRG